MRRASPQRPATAINFAGVCEESRDEYPRTRTSRLEASDPGGQPWAPCARSRESQCNPVVVVKNMQETGRGRVPEFAGGCGAKGT